ncbi:DUF4249 domain-containing protein [Pedobacter boryungensis]|uniref:DUF4249 domain-containing protein n=1 Tax=Pedobacter boryungensis TaxID=869962 RepID=A0ABX2DC48_9SPHI|nr:DUF4249 domain-containing protein [Pedobacter boryungensis]NQX31652.1 DUF4249 domain-containing protein [Pedobacter boryungensis]
MKAYKYTYLILLTFIVMSCKQSFKPEVTTINSNLLVVEGMINAGADSTIIKLSRTVIIANKNTAKPEIGATVVVESDANEKYPLIEELPGKYAKLALNLNSNKKYRLSIKTKGGVSYLSDFVEAKITPPIDSVSWAAKNDGVQLYANTHDATNNTRYYRWEYVETWLFHAEYESRYISDGKKILDRDMNTQNIYTCWQSYKSSSIILGSSSKLENDVMYLSPLTFIPSTSEKIEEKYSILVKQYALTKEAFGFWEKLKKNTESLGSIFDAQPSQLTGNIHNVNDPAEPVIGYISVGTTQQKRIFIPKDKLPKWTTIYPYECTTPTDTVWVTEPKTGSKLEDMLFHSFILVPLDPLYAKNGTTIIGHYGTTKQCGDCTIRGTNKKPDFWQ